MSRSFIAPTRQAAGGGFLSFVKPSYRKDYHIPGLDYQVNGIRSFSLWNSYPSVIRIIPGYDKATGEVFRQNVNCNEFAFDTNYLDYLSETVNQAAVVTNFGQRGQTFITSYAPGSEDALKFGGNTVIDTFTKSIMYSVKNTNEGKRARFQVTPEMRKWCSREGALKYSRPSLLMQALVFVRNGFNMQDENKQPLVDEYGQPLPLLAVVAIEGQQTVQNILTALVEPANANEPLDAATNNKYGAMCEMEGNLLFLNNVQDVQSKRNMLRPSVQQPGQGWTPTPYPLTEEEVKSWWVPWDDLLQYLTAEEQCELLANEFGPDTVNYIIGTDANMSQVNIPEKIKAAGLGRYEQFVNGGGQQKQASYGAPSRSSASFGIPRPPMAQRPAQAPQQNTAEQVMSQAFTPARPPKSAPPAAPAQRPAFSGLRPNTAMDMEKLRSTMSGINRATQQGSMANKAQELLNDTDLDDYQDPNFNGGENDAQF